MANSKISGLTSATTPLDGTEVLPIVQSSTTKKVANNDLRPKQIQSNATSGVLQVAGPTAGTTRVMTTPDANFTAARTDAANSFTGDQTLSTGNLIQGTAAKGFNFTANTGAAGKTSQLLNWYEEGTWTPTLTASSSNPTVTYGLQRGLYTRVGRQVTVTCYMSWTAFTGGSGDVYVSGLPFTVESGTGAYGGAAIASLDGITYGAGRTAPALLMLANTTSGRLACMGSAVATTTIATTAVAASGNIVFTSTYFV